MADALGIVEEFYQALRTGDVERVVALLSSDHLEWTEAERFPYYGGVWRRAKDVVDHLFIPLSRDWEGFTVQPREFIANGEKVVSLGQVRGHLPRDEPPLDRAVRAPMGRTRRQGREVRPIYRHGKGHRGDHSMIVCGMVFNSRDVSVHRIR